MIVTVNVYFTLIRHAAVYTHCLLPIAYYLAPHCSSRGGYVRCPHAALKLHSYRKCPHSAGTSGNNKQLRSSSIGWVIRLLLILPIAHCLLHTTPTPITTNMCEYYIKCSQTCIRCCGIALDPKRYQKPCSMEDKHYGAGSLHVDVHPLVQHKIHQC